MLGNKEPLLWTAEYILSQIGHDKFHLERRPDGRDKLPILESAIARYRANLV